MSRISTLAQLNDRFVCPTCTTHGTWRATARPQSRLNSTIVRLCCTVCGEHVVAKVMPLTQLRAGERQIGQSEYGTLLMLQSVFPQNDHYGTLDPLGYLEFDGSGVLVTRAFQGHNLSHHARALDAEGLRRMYHAAGTLLRILHDCSPKAGETSTLDAAARVDSLVQIYGASLGGNPSIRAAFAVLQRQAPRVGAISLRSAWSHGDFKPGNVLYDGHRSVVLDTQLEHCSAIVYDVASFLNHLLLAKHRSHLQFEQTFLAGYGDFDEQQIAALRWAQLYFMLCYWARDHQRSALVALRARITMIPSIKLLAEQCDGARAVFRS